MWLLVQLCAETNLVQEACYPKVQSTPVVTSEAPNHVKQLLRDRADVDPHAFSHLLHHPDNNLSSKTPNNIQTWPSYQCRTWCSSWGCCFRPPPPWQGHCGNPSWTIHISKYCICAGNVWNLMVSFALGRWGIWKTTEPTMKSKVDNINRIG